MAELFALVRDNFAAADFFSTLLNTVLTIYGIAFVFNLVCVWLVVRRFLRLYAVQSGDDFVMSSSRSFEGGKNNLSVQVWLMLLIPLYFIPFILIYAYRLRRLYPQAKVNVVPYWILSLGATVVCLLLATFLNYAIDLNNALCDEEISGNFFLLPDVALMMCLLACYVMQYLTINKYFVMPEIQKDDE